MERCSDGWMKKGVDTTLDDCVKVVRCRDCKHMGYDSVCAMNCCNILGHYTTGNDFCSHGKKKEV